MYDARNEWREFIGSNRQDAVAKACSYFSASEDDLEIAELPTGEVYGLGARSLVVAALKDRRRPAPGGRGPERGAERGQERGGERHGGRHGDSRRGPREGGGREGGGRGPRPGPVAAPAATIAPAAPEEPSVGQAKTPLSPVGEFVLGMIERMEVGPFELTEAREGELIAIGLRGPAASRVSAGDARSIDAITLLANQAVMRTGDENIRVVIDAEGDSERREEYLARLAERAAKRATETGRSVAIDPMNPKDRRIVHVALRDYEGVATMSVGAGRYRQVVVVPEGAPEWDEARRQAEGANRSDG